jgi:photosystem II stability/assembly factor-like uncharacterized protein
MKSVALICMLLVVFLPSSSSSSTTSWTKIDFTGGEVIDLVSFPSNTDIMLACIANHGIYRSTDRGNHWLQIVTEPCYDISISEEGIAFIAGVPGVLKSTDFGVTWATVNSSTAWKVVAYRDSIVAADTRKPLNGKNVWELSHDNGVTWALWEGTKGTTSLLFHNNGRVYRSINYSIYRNVPENWNLWTCLMTTYYMNLKLGFALNDSVFYGYSRYVDYHPAGYEAGGVYRSTTGCVTWTQYTDITSVSSLERSDSTLIIGTPDGILYTARIGSETKTAIGSFGGEITAIDAKRFSAGEIIIGTKGGIYKTTNGGKNWEKSDIGIQHAIIILVQSVLLENGVERIIVSAKDSGILYSDNSGDNWTVANPEVRVVPGLLRVSESSPHRLYAAGASIYLSDDNGESWNRIPSVPISYYGSWYGRTVDIEIDPQDKEHIVFNFNSHSMDDIRGISYIDGRYVKEVYVIEDEDWYEEWFEWVWKWKHPFYESDYGQSYRSQFSNDGNLTWVSTETATEAFLIALDDSSNVIHTIPLPCSRQPVIWRVENQRCYVFDENKGHFWMSPDLGATWNSAYLFLNNYIEYDDWAIGSPLGNLVLSPDKEILFLLYPGNGILASSDNGLTWGHYDAGINSNVVYQLCFSPSDSSIVYAATADGLYRGTVPDEIVHVDENNRNPKVYPVITNNPNPFNPSTTITYTLLQYAKTTLEVYAITGQKITTLVDGPMSAGTHSVVFDGSKYSSGVYFYRLESAGLTKTGKMLLVK